jgi:hypothetical protein
MENKMKNKQRTCRVNGLEARKAVHAILDGEKREQHPRYYNKGLIEMMYNMAGSAKKREGKW